MSEVKARFNTEWERSAGAAYKWRVMVNGTEYLAKRVAVSVPCLTTEDVLSSGVTKWHITCHGRVTETDGNFWVDALDFRMPEETGGGAEFGPLPDRIDARLKV